MTLIKVAEWGSSRGSRGACASSWRPPRRKLSLVPQSKHSGRSSGGEASVSHSTGVWLPDRSSWYCSSTSEALTRVVATKVFVGSPRFCGLVNSETSMSYSYLVRVAMLKQFVWLYSICVGYVRCIAVPRVFFSEQTCITS